MPTSLLSATSLRLRSSPLPSFLLGAHQTASYRRDKHKWKGEGHPLLVSLVAVDPERFCCALLHADGTCSYLEPLGLFDRGDARLFEWPCSGVLPSANLAGNAPPVALQPLASALSRRRLVRAPRAVTVTNYGRQQLRPHRRQGPKGTAAKALGGCASCSHRKSRGYNHRYRSN